MKTQKKPISIKEVLADANHPNTFRGCHKLECGKIDLCACIGPGYGEPYCPCEMTRRGLPSSPERIAEAAAAEDRLKAVV